MTDQEKKTYADMEALCRLKDMEVGKPIAEHHMAAINHFFGEALSKIKPVSTTIHLDQGEPFTTGHDLGITANGKTLPHRL